MASIAYTGIVKHNGLEGGFWELETDGGMRYQLRGAAVTSLRNGVRCEVQGRVTEDEMGIGMTGGPILDVASIKSLG